MGQLVPVAERFVQDRWPRAVEAVGMTRRGAGVAGRHGRHAAGDLRCGAADTVVSSLVLHQCPMAMKQAMLASMLAVLRPGGRVVIADYGLHAPI
jgi:Methyltransferase domain